MPQLLTISPDSFSTYQNTGCFCLTVCGQKLLCAFGNNSIPYNDEGFLYKQALTTNENISLAKWAALLVGQTLELKVKGKPPGEIRLARTFSGEGQHRKISPISPNFIVTNKNEAIAYLQTISSKNLSSKGLSSGGLSSFYSCPPTGVQDKNVLSETPPSVQLPIKRTRHVAELCEKEGTPSKKPRVMVQGTLDSYCTHFQQSAAKEAHVSGCKTPPGSSSSDSSGDETRGMPIS